MRCSTPATRLEHALCVGHIGVYMSRACACASIAAKSLKCEFSYLEMAFDNFGEVFAI
ncbi:hypothetical protein A2U01_0051381, partial [Trifolium medium]|nr:hypothetical protein [Trifolium medium]